MPRITNTAGTGATQFDIFISEPPTGHEGQVIIDSSTNQIKVYYSGSWQVLHTLSTGGDGISLWLFYFTTLPS